MASSELMSGDWMAAATASQEVLEVGADIALLVKLPSRGETFDILVGVVSALGTGSLTGESRLRPDR